MGSAASFAVLGSTTVTCTGLSTITGNLGVGPAGSAVSGFPAPCTIVGGTIQAGTANPVALKAHNDAQTAYNALVAEPCTNAVPYTPTDVLGVAPLDTLGPGVYCFSSSAELNGTLTLTGGGPWIFRTGSTLTTASGSSVVVNGSSTGCNPGVFWAVGSAATLGTGTQFQGVIIAVASDTLTTGANESGGVFALNGAVTLDTNDVSTCNTGGNSGGPPSACTLLQSSSIASNFNGTSIPGGDFIWFSANASISGIPTSGGPQTVSVTNQAITIPGVGSFSLPDSEVTFSSIGCASVSFDVVTGTWDVNVPFSGSDEIFIGGFVLPVPAGGFPGGIKDVTWSGNIASSAAGASINWKWGAAVYTAFSTDYNALGVKPTHTNACGFNNSDHAGTPEDFKRFAVGGARGGGAANSTGSWSGTATSCRPPKH